MLWGMGARGEALAYGAIALLALGLRLLALDERPFQYDEGQVAYFSWVLATTGDYHYQPVLHGPLTYYLTALTFLGLGATDFTARLVPALAGTGLVLLPAAIRDQLGRTAALTCALLLAISPAFLYYSRFAREDALLAFLTLALVVVAIRLYDRPRAWHPAALGALLAASFAAKEATFISVAIAGAGLLGAAVAGWPVAEPLRALRWRPWAIGVATFAVAFAALFTTGSTHPGGLVDAVWDGPRYWASEHRVHRGGEGWGLYLTMFASYEWLALALGGAGAVVALRRRQPLELALLWWLLAATAVYSYAGERFAWLVLQPLLPLVLLAGVGLQAIARRRRPALVMALAAIAATLTGAVAVRTALERGDDPRELLAVVPTADIDPVLQRVETLAQENPRLTVEVDVSEFSTYPWAWHFRDLRAAYPDMQHPDFRPSGDVLVVTPLARELLAPELGDYEGHRFVSRRWWVRDYDRVSPAALVRWWTSRETWGERGRLESWLYVRRLPLRP